MLGFSGRYDTDIKIAKEHIGSKCWNLKIKKNWGQLSKKFSFFDSLIYPEITEEPLFRAAGSNSSEEKNNFSLKVVLPSRKNPFYLCEDLHEEETIK